MQDRIQKYVFQLRKIIKASIYITVTSKSRATKQHLPVIIDVLKIINNTLNSRKAVHLYHSELFNICQ